MGSTISSVVERMEKFGYAVAFSPIVFDRPTDYSDDGNPKQCIQQTWELAMRTMVSADLMTRKLFKPIIHARMESMRVKKSYWHDRISNILPLFPQWSESEIFEFHDLFQMFEVTDSNQMDIADLIVGLANFNDKTPLKTRFDVISHYNDGNGFINFQNFLHLMKFLYSPENEDHTLRKTFDKLLEINRYVRQMAVTQQVLTGFL